MKGRPYTRKDMAGMREALALVTAYDMGTEPNEFGEFKELINESDPKIKEHLTQLAWLLLRSMEASSRVSRQEILSWYGVKFANAQFAED